MSAISGTCLPETFHVAAMEPLAASPAGTTSSSNRSPPRADHPVTREADLLGRLERRLVHHAPAPEDDEIRLLLANLQPLRALLVARGGRPEIRTSVELVQRGLGFHGDDGFLAVGGVAIQETIFLPSTLPPSFSLMNLTMADACIWAATSGKA